MILPVYLRREPTTDALLISRGMTDRSDVVAYRDPECQNRFARWPWYMKRPDRRNKQVTLNCYQWAAVWLPDVAAATS
jgi:hypothetical protein